MKEIFFFRNGNTVVVHNNEQVPKLQESWLKLFAKHLESKGEDPAEYLLHLSDTVGRFFRTDDGDWNWRLD